MPRAHCSWRRSDSTRRYPTCVGTSAECKRRKDRRAAPKWLVHGVPRRARSPRAHGGRRPRPAGDRPDAQPLHDRARRGGDAPALPRRGRTGRRRDRHRRHRLPRPHDRDRALVRRPRDRARVDGLLRGRAQRLVRRGERRLAALPRRRRGARPAGRGAAARADGPDVARGLLPRRDQLHRRLEEAAPRSPTTPCASSATAPSTASAGACTSRSRTTCPAYLPERIEQTTVRVEHYGYLGASATRRRSRAATSSCCSRRRPRARRRRSSTSTSAPSTPPPATRGSARRVRAGLGDDPGRRPRRPATSSPRR